MQFNFPQAGLPHPIILLLVEDLYSATLSLESGNAVRIDISLITHAFTQWWLFGRSKGAKARGTACEVNEQVWVP